MTDRSLSKDILEEPVKRRMRYGFWLILISLLLISGLLFLWFGYARCRLGVWPMYTRC
jgi:hypothetical protein